MRAFGHPTDADPERFHLIAPYESDAKRWPEQTWIDQYTGKPYLITTAGHFGTRQTARVKTYGEILREYEFHPGSKCADATGRPSGKQTVGLLQRRHIQVDHIKYIGKESHNLEEVESGLVHSPQSVYTEYPDPQRDEWQRKIVPALRKITLSVLEKESGLCRRMLIKARMGNVRPHLKNQKLLAAILRRLDLI